MKWPKASDILWPRPSNVYLPKMPDHKTMMKLAEAEGSAMNLAQMEESLLVQMDDITQKVREINEKIAEVRLLIGAMGDAYDSDSKQRMGDALIQLEDWSGRWER